MFIWDSSRFRLAFNCRCRNTSLYWFKYLATEVQLENGFTQVALTPYRDAMALIFLPTKVERINKIICCFKIYPSCYDNLRCRLQGVT